MPKLLLHYLYVWVCVGFDACMSTPITDEEFHKEFESLNLDVTKTQEDLIKQALPEGLNVELMPKHVAIILDGNRRWAFGKGMTASQGHIAGQKAVREIIFLSSKWGIKVLSLFAFSTENWIRPQEEVDFLMNLFEEAIITYEKDCVRYNYRCSFIGDKSRLHDRLRSLMESVEEKTMSNKGLHIILAVNYSGRYDIMQATKRIASKVKDGTLQLDDINDASIDEELQTNCAKFPAPDLLIRTSGEQRISNFMLWQLAYSELYFCEKKFPDFAEQDYVDALMLFQKRDRRYGGKKY